MFYAFYQQLVMPGLRILWNAEFRIGVICEYQMRKTHAE